MSEINLNHRLLKARPNFASAYESFKLFVLESRGDLQTKKEALENHRKILKSSHSFDSRQLKSYLSCQIFMLRKHLSRLQDFEHEVDSRLQDVLHQNSNSSDEKADVNSNSTGSEGSTTDQFEITSLNSTKSSSDSAESGYSGCSSNLSNLFGEKDTVDLSGVGEQDQELIRLLADINKMKRRCKHILDVTDQYCVLGFIKSGESDPDGNRCQELSGNHSVFNHMIWSTLESFSRHMMVITKSYTKRHSTEMICSSKSN